MRFTYRDNVYDYDKDIDGVEFLREAVAWADSRPEFLNEDMSPIALLNQFNDEVKASQTLPAVNTYVFVTREGQETVFKSVNSLSFLEAHLESVAKELSAESEGAWIDATSLTEVNI